MDDIQLNSVQYEAIKCPNITYLSTTCLLCGKSIPIPSIYSNISMVCNECKKKWEKMCKMLDVIEDLATNEDN